MTDTQHKPSLGFRYDINGLRAYAVMLVMLFHFSVFGFDSGFFGVDIFFVISGFLMTAIVTLGLEKGKFSIWTFYLSRLRRIAPALAALIVVLLALGWFWLPTPDYQELGRQAYNAISFNSNVHFNKTAGYFDSAAHEKWLLHTWTLGVEFQFYIFLPLLLLVVWKIKPTVKSLLMSLLIFWLISFVLSIVVTKVDPTYAFYLLPTRAWEFLTGGVVFLLGRNLKAPLASLKATYILGFVLLAVSVFLIDESLAWPSYWAALPVLATALIIFSNRSTSILVKHPLAQWLGDRSYSIYLWHWPVVVAMAFAGVLEENAWQVFGIILSLFLGHLSYHLIENPTRTNLIKLGKKKEAAILLCSIAVLFMAGKTIRKHEYEGRLPANIEQIAKNAKDYDAGLVPCEGKVSKNGSPQCVYTSAKEEGIGAIVLGDSHAEHSLMAAAKSAKANNKGIKSFAKPSCPPILGIRLLINNIEEECLAYNEWLFNEAYSEFKAGVPIIVIERLALYAFGDLLIPEEKRKPTAYFDEKYVDLNDSDFLSQFETKYIESLCYLSKNNPVYVTRPYPEFNFSVPQIVIRNAMFGKRQGTFLTLAEYKERNAYTWAVQDKALLECGIKIIDPLTYLCDEKQCRGDVEGESLYIDSDHLNSKGNNVIAPMFLEVFK